MKIKFNPIGPVMTCTSAFFMVFFALMFAKYSYWWAGPFFGAFIVFFGCLFEPVD